MVKLQYEGLKAAAATAAAKEALSKWTRTFMETQCRPRDDNSYDNNIEGDDV